MQLDPTQLSRLRGFAIVSTIWAAAAGLSVASMLAVGAPAGTTAPVAPTASQSSGHLVLDRSGRPQVGTASFYANRYSGRTMSNGRPMSLYANNAASLTLPLGTTARVTNLETGSSAIVVIEDRGPYVNGRIIDLSPGTARKIGLAQRQGLVRVEVTPLSVPLVDGTVKVFSANRVVSSGARGG